MKYFFLIIILIIGESTVQAQLGPFTIKPTVNIFKGVPVILDTCSINFYGRDTLSLKETNLGASKLIIPTTLRTTLLFSNYYGLFFDTAVYKEPHPTITVKLRFVLSQGLHPSNNIILDPIFTADTIIKKISLMEFQHIAPYSNNGIPVYILDLKFPIKRYYEKHLKKGHDIQRIDEEITIEIPNYNTHKYLYSQFTKELEIIEYKNGGY